MYTAKNIRNIALLGHGGDGKTMLAEDMLYLTKGSDRLGSIAAGTTVSDFDPEETKRQYSISTSLIPVEFEGTKINILDNPGFFDFAGEIVQSLRVADAGMIVLSAKGGIAVGTEKAWKSLKDAGLPAMFYISKMDEENANYYKVVDDMRAMFGNTVVPLQFPIMNGDKCVGLVDVLSKTARDTEGNDMALTADAEARLEEYLAALSEQVAETSEELMDKFFMEEPFTQEELVQGLKDGLKQRSITPVFAGSAVAGYGSKRVMEYIVKFCPNPLEGLAMQTEDGAEVALDPNGSPVAFVYKTISDQFGKNSFFKVISGEITEGMSVNNIRTGGSEKLSNIFFAKGKNQTKTAKIACGDIGVATKLGSVKTGDTLGLAGKTTAIKGMEYDEPCYKMAIYAKVKGQEDKIAAGLTKLNEEDCSFTYGTDTETKEMVIAGVGDIHLGVICSKLANKFKVEAELRPAKIAYRETIKKKVEIHGRHKKQSGGHGQFGDVHIRFQPQSETEDMIFVDETVGGCVPKNFIPSVEKGLRNCI
ncbi:MAG: elongation factor G, partial [Oscillospiraceae bacterium]|nr:elongation factor G [Oscillospiraceae bacterium]